MARKRLSAHWPKPPCDLADVNVWASLCTDLDSIGVLIKVDAKLIERYCRDYALCMRVEKQLAEESLTLETPSGKTFTNPLLNSYSTLSKGLCQTLRQMGLTPAARKAKAAIETDHSPFKAIGKGDI